LLPVCCVVLLHFRSPQVFILSGLRQLCFWFLV
jgi:hypothetical protein